MIFLFLHLCFCPFFPRIYWKQRLLPAGCRGVLHTPHHMTPKGAKDLFLHLCFYPYAIHVEIMPFGATIYRLISSFLHLLFIPSEMFGGRMQYAPTSYRQKTLYLINSQEERTETKIQNRKNHPLGCRGVLHTPNRMTPKGAKNSILYLLFISSEMYGGRMLLRPTA